MKTTYCARRMLAAVAAAVLAALVSPAVRADDGPDRNHQPPPNGPASQIRHFSHLASPAGDLNERLDQLQQRLDEAMNQLQQLRHEIAQRPPINPGAEGRKPSGPPRGPDAEGRKPRKPPMGPDAEGRKPRKPPMGPDAEDRKPRKPPMGPAGAEGRKPRKSPVESGHDRKPDDPPGKDGLPSHGGPTAEHNAGMDPRFPSEFEAAPILPTGF